MKETIDLSASDDLGNEWTIYGDGHLRISGVQEDAETDGKTSYEYYFNEKAASRLEEILIEEFGEEKPIEEILTDEFDFSEGIGTLHFYCERRRIPHTFEW